METVTASRSSSSNGKLSAVSFLLAGLFISTSFGQLFPGQNDDTTPSLGVFRIYVDPLFRPLLSPTGSPTFFNGYTGFHTSDGRLTSPMLADRTTTIGRSNPNSRFYPFPVPIGLGSWDIIGGYGDYPAIPFLWAAAPPPTEEVLTEVKSFVLVTVSGADGQLCTNSMVPQVPPGYAMVKAGTFAGVAPRSLGMVQENTANGPANPDFPARSFFDIFVEVNLPPLPGTESSVAFPPTGAVLTNGQPLIVTNLNLTSFPPSVVYIHGGNTNAVELRFKDNNPPYWAAGDLFGTLILAGHGTFTNDCSQEAALTAAVLGTPNNPMPETPTEWLRPNNLFPSVASAYQSLLTDTNPPAGSDTLQFTIPAQGTIYLRNLVVNSFSNSIVPPTPGLPGSYSWSNVLASFSISLDNVNFFPSQATGLVSIQLSNSTPAGSSLSTFDTEMLSLSLSGTTFFGPMRLRESPTLHSLGKHTIRSESRGLRIGSFFDVFTELSTDGGTSWIPANRSMRVSANAPPAAPGSLFVTPSTGAVKVQWLGPFTLQSASSVLGPFTDISGSTGGSLNNIWTFPFGTNKLQFFRLRQ